MTNQLAAKSTFLLLFYKERGCVLVLREHRWPEGLAPNLEISCRARLPIGLCPVAARLCMVVTSTTCGWPFRFAHHLTQLKNNDNFFFFFSKDEAFAAVHASIARPAWLTAVRGWVRPKGWLPPLQGTGRNKKYDGRRWVHSCPGKCKTNYVHVMCGLCIWECMSCGLAPWHWWVLLLGWLPTCLSAPPPSLRTGRSSTFSHEQEQIGELVPKILASRTFEVLGCVFVIWGVNFGGATN